MSKIKTQFDLFNSNGMPMCLEMSGNNRNYCVWIGYYHDCTNHSTHHFSTKKAAMAAYNTLADFYSHAETVGENPSPTLSRWVLAAK
jgi:hypothetical protein